MAEEQEQRREFIRYSSPELDKTEQEFGDRVISAVEMPLKFVRGNVAGCLPNDSAQSPGVEFGVIGDGQCLLLAIWPNPPQLHMASLLRLHFESE